MNTSSEQGYLMNWRDIIPELNLINLELLPSSFPQLF